MMKHLLSISLSVLAGAALLTACTDDKYDFEKLDTTVTLFEDGVSMPVGGTGKITLKKILENSGVSMDSFTTGADGNYLFKLSDDITSSFNVPGTSFSDIEETNIDYEISVPAAYVGLDTSLPGVPEEMDLGGMEGDGPISFDAPLPENVIDVKWAEVTSNATIAMTMDQPVYIKEGFAITFPAAMEMTLVTPSDDYSFEGGVLTFAKDLKLGTTPYTIKLKLNKINTEGLVADGKIAVNKTIAAKGSTFVKKDDYPTVPASVKFHLSFSVDPIVIGKVSAKLSYSETFSYMENVKYQLAKLNDQGVYVNLADPTLDLNLTNLSPIGINFDASVSLMKNSVIVKTQTLADDEKIEANAKYSKNFKLTELTGVIPEFFRADFRLETDDSKFVDINLGSSYSFNGKYAFSTGVSVDPSTKVSYETSSINLGLSNDSGSADVTVSMDVINSLPLEMKLQVIGIDANGNKTGTLATSQAIAPGSQANPVTTSCDLSLNVGKTGAKSIILQIDMSGSAAMSGVALNENQGIQIKNIVVELPNGLTI